MAGKAKGNNLQLLHKPVHPVLALVVILISLVGVGSILMLALQSNRKPISTPQQYQSQLTSTLTPAPTVNPAYFLLTPTPTLAPGQKAIYTFYIQATSHRVSRKGITLTQSDTGKVYTIDIGTFIVVNFGRVGKFQVSLASPQDIFQCVGAECLPHSAPNNSLFASWVSHTGTGTITVIETN